MNWNHYRIFSFLLAAAVAVGQEMPPKHEIGLTLGRLGGVSRNGANTSLELGSGVAFQANYAYRLYSGDKTALYGEVHFLANPLRDLSSATTSLTKDVATIYATPGIRLRFLPLARVSPWVTVGGGYALYEQSLFQLDNQPNTAPRFTHRAALAFGGGADILFWRFIGLRAEIRDFYSGSPSYNTNAISGGQHNLVIGGGLVLKFR